MQRQAEGSVHAGDQQRLPGRHDRRRRGRQADERGLLSDRLAPRSADCDGRGGEPRAGRRSSASRGARSARSCCRRSRSMSRSPRIRSCAPSTTASTRSCRARATSSSGFANYAELFRDEHLLAGGPQHHPVGVRLAAGRSHRRAAARARALLAKVPGTRFFRIAWFTPVLMSYVVVGIIWVWIYNYDWGAVNVAAARARARRPRARLARRSEDRAAGPDLRHHAGCGSASTWSCCWPRCTRCRREVIEAAELDNCGWGAKLVRHHPARLADDPQPAGAVVHRQDEDLRPGLDHDQGRAVVVDRDRVDLRLQARLRVDHVRPRLSVDDRRRVVRDRAGRGARC